MISDSVELWDTDVCFLHMHNWSGLMFDFQKRTNLRLMLILSLQDLLQNLNLEITACPHDNIGGNHSRNECMKLIVPIVCHMLESILWQIVPVCWLSTDCPDCQVDQFVPRTSIFNTIWEQTSGNSPLFYNSSFYFWWSSKQGLETLKSCSAFLFANPQHRSTHFRACPSTS